MKSQNSPVPAPHLGALHNTEHAQIKETMSSISRSCQSNHVNIGTVADSIETRAFCILLLLPALVILLPVSLIPGVSSICAAVVLFMGFHIFFKREKIWLPQKIRAISFNGNKMVRILEKTDGVTKNIDRFSKPRFMFMTEGVAGNLAFAMVILLATATIFLGFIPFMDIALTLPIVLFALGSYAHDGLITGIGWLILGICAGAVGFFI